MPKNENGNIDDYCFVKNPKYPKNSLFFHILKGRWRDCGEADKEDIRLKIKNWFVNYVERKLYIDQLLPNTSKKTSSIATNTVFT